MFARFKDDLLGKAFQICWQTFMVNPSHYFGCDHNLSVQRNAKSAMK